MERARREPVLRRSCSLSIPASRISPREPPGKRRLAIVRHVPTIHREAGYAFRFRANDRSEPPHVHVEGNDGRAKFWLPDAGLVRSEGYNRRQLAAIQIIVAENAERWLRQWHDFFD